MWLLRRWRRKMAKKWNLTVQLTALIIQLINEWVNTQCLPIYHFIYYHILCLDWSSNGTCKLSSAPILCMHFGCAFFAFFLEIKNWENVYCHENTWTYSKWIKDTAHIKFSASRLLYLSLFFFLCYVWRDQIIFYGVLDLFSSSSFGKRKRPQFKHEQYSMWNVLESNSWHSYMLMGFYDCSQEEQPQQQQSITALYVAVIVWFDVIRQ